MYDGFHWDICFVLAKVFWFEAGATSLPIFVDWSMCVSTDIISDLDSTRRHQKESRLCTRWLSTKCLLLLPADHKNQAES